MEVQAASQQRQPVDLTAFVPATAIEKIYQRWDPREYELQSQMFGCTVIALGGVAGNTNNIQAPELIYVFAFLSRAFNTVGGGYPAVPYRIGFKTSREDWTNGQWHCAMVTGDVGSTYFQPRIFDSPRMVGQNEIVIPTVDNNINGAGNITVDCAIWGYVVRQIRRVR